MSGERFLVSLLEVQHSEIILACRTLIKENVNFWDGDLKNNYDNPINDELLLTLGLNTNEISELTLSPETEEVATTIAGFIAKKLIKRSKCSNCKSMLATDASNINICQYLQILSRGGLTVPSLSLKDFTCGCFATLDNLSYLITKQGANVKDVSSFVLSKYFPTCFTCDLHKEWGFKFASKIIINVFF